MSRVEIIECKKVVHLSAGSIHLTRGSGGSVYVCGRVTEGVGGWDLIEVCTSVLLPLVNMP